MNYWINTVSSDHVSAGVAGGFTQANHGSLRNLRRMSRGDLLVFYSPKTKYQNGEPLQQFTALGQIINDELFQVVMHENFKPFRREVVFYDCKEASIHPLINDLRFIKNKKKWGFPFRRGLFMIEKSDFMHIADAMEVSRDLLGQCSSSPTVRTG